MADVLLVLLLVALFAVTAGVVAACDRLVGAEEGAALPAVEVDEAQRPAA
jgi:hypothetical protein